MSKHLQMEIEALKSKVVALGELVESQLRRAIDALAARDPEAAEEVIQGDSVVDEREVELEEDCLKLLALYQPVAQDLRFIVSVLKINNDLERIGDLAESIGRRAKSFCRGHAIDVPGDVQTMAKKVKLMLRKSLLSLVELNPSLAREVLSVDDEVDVLHANMYAWALAQVQRMSEHAEQFFLLLFVSRNLERIADLASNIAEDVVYLVQGDIVRHKKSI
ncbi:MAG: phosphate signaling complex protein PhoU [Deltaproteobacteria bacterium]|nr:phosphate signaling complex protein PhoU [Deltaproteobacteria bacterium]